MLTYNVVVPRKTFVEFHNIAHDNNYILCDKTLQNLHAYLKSIFQSSKRDYWRNIAVIPKNNYNTVPVINGEFQTIRIG